MSCISSCSHWLCCESTQLRYPGSSPGGCLRERAQPLFAAEPLKSGDTFKIEVVDPGRHNFFIREWSHVTPILQRAIFNRIWKWGDCPAAWGLWDTRMGKQGASLRTIRTSISCNQIAWLLGENGQHKHAVLIVLKMTNSKATPENPDAGLLSRLAVPKVLKTSNSKATPAYHCQD